MCTFALTFFGLSQLRIRMGN